MSAVAATLSFLLFPPPALLQDTSADDYRAKVFLAYTLVFAAIIVYLVASHRKNRRVREELEALERRLRELEAKNPG